MNDERAFERMARAWLELGPTKAPDRAVQAALMTIESTRQQPDPRILQRSYPMTATTRIAAVAIIAVMAIGAATLYMGGQNSSNVGLPTSPSPSPSPSPAPSPAPSAGGSPASSSGPSQPPSPGPSQAVAAIPDLDQTFTSPRYGYSVRIPRSWQASAASAGWDPTAGVSSDGLDTLEGEIAGLRAASEALAPGQTAQDWYDTYIAMRGSCQPLGQWGWTRAPVEGTIGIVVIDGCGASSTSEPDAGRIYEVIVVSGGRGYTFILTHRGVPEVIDTFPGPRSVHHEDLRTILDSVALDPASAVDG